MLPMRRLTGSIFPALARRCAVCGALLPAKAQQFGDESAPAGICTACRSELKPRIAGYCPRCGLLFAKESEAVSLCLDCRLSPPPWSEAFFYGPYAGLLKDLVLGFKFDARLGSTLVLRDLLAAALSRHGSRRPESRPFDLTVPIPLHPGKLRSRGFNQSLELARGLPAGIAGILAPQTLVRIRDTPDQHNLSRMQRLKNLKDAFQADPGGVRGQSVLVVDDILTTGATARAAAKALLAAGAAKVSLAVVARA